MTQTCCLKDGQLYKSPAEIDLRGLKPGGVNDGCYLRETEACSSSLSGEHSVSRSVLRVLGDKSVKVSGFPWLKGEEKAIGIESLVSRNLCTAHNNILSPLDTAAGRFFKAVADCSLRAQGAGDIYLFCGHDIERWMLKVLAGLADSKNLAIDGGRLEGPLIHQ